MIVFLKHSIADRLGVERGIDEHLSKLRDAQISKKV